MSEAGPGTVSMPSRHRNSPARHAVQDTPSPCTPRGEGEGSPSAAAQLSPLSAFGLRTRNGIETVPHGTPCRTYLPPAPPGRTGIPLFPMQDRHPLANIRAAQIPQPGGAGPTAKRRRSSSQAEQVLQPGGAGPFSRGTPAPPIQHPRFPAAQVLQEKTDLRQNAPGLASGCPRTCARMPQDLRRPIGGPRHTTAFPAVTGLWHRCGSRRGGEDGEMSLVPCHDGTLAPLWVPSRRGRRRNAPRSTR